MYFEDLRPALKRFSDQELGQLFRAVFNYAESKQTAELAGEAGLLFELLRPKLDRDEDRYRAACRQRRYAAYARETRRQGQIPESFDEWDEPLPF